MILMVRGDDEIRRWEKLAEQGLCRVTRQPHRRTAHVSLPNGTPLVADDKGIVQPSLTLQECERRGGVASHGPPKFSLQGVETGHTTPTNVIFTRFEDMELYFPGRLISWRVAKRMLQRGERGVGTEELQDSDGVIQLRWSPQDGPSYFFKHIDKAKEFRQQQGWTQQQAPIFLCGRYYELASPPGTPRLPNSSPATEKTEPEPSKKRFLDRAILER